eukprot:CAMPEP_0114976346 /NCGR_PEP_ID=MMETSP0216-20121206/2618_1 /TAXON_ID=223996 /ORGANISM="Protocruzia adherens, Strain Boccale" /LENGTH=605 /DNA_ID=CAMNT_0002337257 /DNA_START=70 /DNA_END=1887 /DNA_ORIENTATION=-
MSAISTLFRKHPRLLLTLGLLKALLIHYLWSLYQRRKRYHQAYIRAQEAVDHRDHAISNINFLEIRPQKESQIINASIDDLSRLLDSHEITSVEIVTTFLKRTLKHGRDHELTSIELFREALDKAQLCDDQRGRCRGDRAKLRRLGRFHGIPFAVSDVINVRGTPSSCGLIRLLDGQKELDHPYVAALKGEGAILLMKANCPQYIYGTESNNNIWGKARNPWNKKKTVGGVSGPDAGLVALRCIPFSLGVDFEGELRIGSAWCGVYGFKPTTRRTITDWGIDKPFSGHTDMVPVVGPIGKNVDDLVNIARFIFARRVTKSSQRAPPLEFNEDQFIKMLNRKLRFGFFTFPKVMEPCDAVKRAMHILRDGLKSFGHVVVEVTFPFNLVEDLEKATSKILHSEKYSFYEAIQTLNEPLKPYNSFYARIVGTSRLVIFLTRLYLRFKGELRVKQLLKRKTFYCHTVGDYNTIVKKKDTAVKELYDAWNSYDVDVLVAPVFPTPATNHNNNFLYNIPSEYSNFASVMGAVAGVLPVTHVQNGEIFYRDRHHDRITNHVDGVMGESRGLPVGIHVMSKPFEDETCLAAMKIADEAIKRAGHGVKLRGLKP